jgi:hypothetical protein
LLSLIFIRNNPAATLQLRWHSLRSIAISIIETRTENAPNDGRDKFGEDGLAWLCNRLLDELDGPVTDSI